MTDRTGRAGAAPAELTAPERSRAQRVAIVANAFSGLLGMVVMGSLMTLYANDVLRFDAREIAGILAALPLAVLLRLPLFGMIRRTGLVRSARFAEALVAVLIAVLIVLPAGMTPYPVFMLLVVAVGMTSQLGIGSVQQPLFRGFTSTRDRGRFFARLRLCWMAYHTLVMVALPLLIRENISETVYKVLLVLCVLGTLNRIFWMRFLPEPPGPDDDIGKRGGDGSLARIRRTLRTSPLLRRPLAIALLLALTSVPIYVIYLKQLLGVPSGVVTVYTAALTLGGALSMLFWGRLADAIGFRPMLAGLLIINMLLAPLQLLLAPFPSGPGFHFHWTEVNLPQTVTILVLAGIGFASGALVAGMGIANTSIDHYHVGNRDSLEAMNISAVAVALTASAVAMFHGFFLKRVALPYESKPFFNGMLHFDWIKGWLLLAGVPLQLAVLWLLRRLPNTRPHFGVGDFFSSLSSNLVRSALALRLVLHDDEDRRAAVARWFGDNVNPVNLEPLFRLLADPSYDVKVATIRSLACTGSPLAGERLLGMLDNPDKKYLADQVAWALGELRHAPAVDALIRSLRSEGSVRTRAMAARALGKIGDSRAVEALAEVLRGTSDDHLVASVSRALVRLGAMEHAEQVFDAFAALTDREERFELADALCDTLGISKRWILLSEHDSLYASLVAYVDERTQGWIDERRAAVDALRAKDRLRIAALLDEAIAAGAADTPEGRGLAGLRAALGRTERWQALTVMAAAWLLFRRG